MPRNQLKRQRLEARRQRKADKRRAEMKHRRRGRVTQPKHDHWRQVLGIAPRTSEISRLGDWLLVGNRYQRQKVA